MEVERDRAGFALARAARNGLPITTGKRGRPMWRAFFLAIGIYMCILGAECLAVERFEMAQEPAAETAGGATLFGSPPATTVSRDIEPPEWAPWSFLSVGTVIILYALTINRGG